MNKSTTDTPRTDAEIWDVVYHHKDEIVVDADFARELERELAETKAEVEFWKDKAHEAEASEGKHEAEVERLRGSLRDQERSLGTSQFYLARAIEIAEIVGWTQNVAYLSELRAELDELKTTLNPTTEDSSEPQL